MSVPFQPVKYFGDIENNQWSNMIIFGDNLQALKHLLKLKDNGELKNSNGEPGVNLIYIDPPFATKEDFKGSKEQKAYIDKLAGADFIEFIRKRLLLMKEILSESGTICVHLDWKKAHYVKIILDEIFSENNFLNEVIWYYRRWNIATKLFARNHDTLLVYAKNRGKHIFNNLYIPKSEKSSAQGKAWKSVIGENGIRRSIKTDEPTKGVPMPDVWQISMINPVGIERKEIGYPTQKPEELLERIIKACSNEGDIIMDMFAGSGTSAAVAEKLGRRWIICDCGKLAIYTSMKRMLNLKNKIGNAGTSLKPKPFILYNAGLYNDKSLIEKTKVDEYKNFILELFNCQKDNHKINGIQMHGTLNNNSVMIFDKDHFLTYEFLDDLHKIVGNIIKNIMYIIAPISVVEFNEDYVKKGKIKYIILRIPNSLIEYIKEKNFTRLKQPRCKEDLNQTIDAIGFDFIYPPNLSVEYYKQAPKDKLLEKEYVINIKEFLPIQIGTNIKEFKDPKAEALAMVMIDLNYNQ